jgi:hypothetical protein
LERELASYRTPHEIADLLGTISDQESPEAEQIRDILLNNQRPTTALSRILTRCNNISYGTSPAAARLSVSGRRLCFARLTS